MGTWAVDAVLVFALIVAVALLCTTPFQDVTRERVERFADRQRLRVTVANGGIVIRYLATTRRWRGVGLLLSLVAAFVVSYLHHDGLHVGLTELFIGWFIGAVIAEWRVSVLSATRSQRSATLTPRRISDYVSGPVRYVAGLALAADVAVTAFAQLDTGRHVLMAALLVLSVFSMVLIWFVARHILERPQPAADPDVLAADESIRSRSLHVLAGSAVAICSWIVPTALELALHGGTQIATHDDGLGVLSALLLILGALIARRASMTPRRPVLHQPTQVTSG